MPVRIRRFLGPLLLAAAGLATASAQAADAVLTASGPVSGTLVQGQRAYLGIPYAVQPVGALRWRAPQPAPAWKEPRAATAYGPACPQGEDRLYGNTPAQQDEACLYLNVFAPPAAAGPLPVMVWLHGGAHRIGAASLPFYDGSRLAARGVVVVTLNYRLGYLGTFAHPALGPADEGGNFGLLDQIQALRWVRDHIAAFGGDPARVTVFGESAGATDVFLLMTSPAARGLFQAAIAQSGVGWVKPPSRETLIDRVMDDLAKVGVPETADAAALRKLDARKLVEAQAGGGLSFGSFIDGKTVLEAPAVAFEQGRQMRVSLIVGSNDWEGSLLQFRGLGVKGELIARLPAVSGWYAGKSADERQVLLFRDSIFAAPARWIAQQHSRHAAAYLYRFAYVTSGRRTQVPGAAHAAEIAYVFDTLDASAKLSAAVGEEDRRMAAQLADCWVAFARTNQPACFGWSAYDPAAQNLLLIDARPRQLADPDGTVLDGVRKYFGPGSWLGG